MRPFIWGAGRPAPHAAYPGILTRRATTLPYLALLRVGFAVPRRLPGRAVGSYPTVSPLPTARVKRAATWAVYSLWHFPSAFAARALPGTLPSGARTFLEPRARAPARGPSLPSRTQKYHDRLTARQAKFGPSCARAPERRTSRRPRAHRRRGVGAQITQRLDHSEINDDDCP